MVLGIASLVIGAVRTVTAADVELPTVNTQAPIHVESPTAFRWQQDGYDMWLLRGGVTIKQSGMHATASEALLWVDEAEAGSDRASQITVYLEGHVRVSIAKPGGNPLLRGASVLEDKSWFGKLQSYSDINLNTKVVGGRPQVQPALLANAQTAKSTVGTRNFVGTRNSEVERVQHVETAQAGTRLPSPVALPNRLPAPGEQMAPVAGRAISVRQRNSTPPNISIRNLEGRKEAVLLVTNGFSIVIDDVVVNAHGDREAVPLGRIDIETDHLVAWSRDVQSLLATGPDGEPLLQPADMPLELYLEGNIIFRQGDRVIYAERMYFDVAQRRGIVLDAELLTGIPNYAGLLRLRADVLHQVNDQRFEAFNASMTSSRMAVPRYWFQSGNLTVVDNPRPRIDPLTGQAVMDPVTREVDVEHDFKATSRNNFVYAGGLPIFYWPVIATDLEEPNFYLDRIRLKSDRVFGNQILADWNLYHLLGIDEPPQESTWTLSTDYLSDRGPALGTQFKYDGNGSFGIPGPVRTLADFWGIHDTGLDDLGSDRRAVVPEETYRGRALLQHRHEMPLNFQLTVEVGWISDRNFLEQYFESEWDLLKDEDTAIELKQYRGLASWDVFAQYQVNDFFMETEWLPRADHYLLGRPLWGGRLTYNEHSHVGYARLNAATAPSDPAELAKFQPLYGEIDTEGVRAASRHELSMPLRIGPTNVVPFIGGEAAYYGNDIMGDDLTRLMGQAGIRTSTAFWKTNPDCRSALFNLNGLSHKVVFESELLFSEADQDLTSIPRYDQLDDNATEFFRRRFFFDTFGGVLGMNIPDRFSDRYFAVRSGQQGWVTSEATDIVEDLMVGHFSVRQRLQTKRGLPGQERVIDWMTFDIDVSTYPKSDRDNFGSLLGMVNYDYRWHLGDRFTAVSDGYFDFFSNGLKTFSVGGILNRPSQGNLYLGYRSIEGPLSSHILSASVDYRMSRKWLMHAGAIVDLGNTGNVGQNVGFTRIGESALVRAGMSYDESRDNLSLQFMIEPRFMPASRTRKLTGIELPPVGTTGIE